MATSNLYRVSKYSNSLGGYVVYRHCFDETRCLLEDGIAAHKTAVFVVRLEADEYAEHRNLLIDKTGDDSLDGALTEQQRHTDRR